MPEWNTHWMVKLLFAFAAQLHDVILFRQMGPSVCWDGRRTSEKICVGCLMSHVRFRGGRQVVKSETYNVCLRIDSGPQLVTLSYPIFIAELSHDPCKFHSMEWQNSWWLVIGLIRFYIARTYIQTCTHGYIWCMISYNLVSYRIISMYIMFIMSCHSISL